MTKNPISIDKDFLAAKALSIMNNKRITSLCVFDKKNKLKKNIFFKRWRNHREKIKVHNYNVKLYKSYLDKLTIYLNKYHKKDHLLIYHK